MPAIGLTRIESLAWSPMFDTEEYGRWRSEADRAMASAEFQASGGIYNWACFALEQASQLAMKGLLHGLGLGPWGHDLVRLGSQLADAGVDVPDEVSSALSLDPPTWF
ncbi:MAG TPA: HEPN domain-containing protein, partial [Acidimicrobiia bacterium]|nr:HEPN domain-containing protein [Acidimicrobiia bacterium]